MSRNQERQLQGLLLIQPRVTVGSVVQAQVLVIKTLASSSALSNVVTSKLKMHAAQEGAVLLVDLQGGGELREDVVEGACLDARGCAAGISSRN